MSAVLAALEAVAPTFPRASRYRVGRAIAEGRTGPVYLGFQRGIAGFERLVVVRRAPEHPREALIAELARTSGLRHPNVVGIDDVEEHEGELWLVSEYVEGATLAELTDLAAERRVSPAIALRIALDVCAALEAIHEAGFVHRAVSAQNVFVGSDGITRVTDFGMPETVRTSRGPRSVPMESDDVVAFAVLLWETVTGRRLTKSASKAPLPASIVADVPPLFDAAVAKALGIWPLERFASIQETRIALEGAAHGFVATHEEVGDFVTQVAHESIDEQRSEIRAKAFVAEDSEEDEERTGRYNRVTLLSSPEIVVPAPAAPPAAPVVVRSIKADLAKLALALFFVAALCLTTAFACGAFYK